ncbi:unnamed protein product [Ectocarpus sp. 12 AP-2014]
MVNLVSRSIVTVLLALCGSASPRDAKVTVAAATNMSTVGEEQQQTEEAPNTSIAVPSIELAAAPQIKGQGEGAHHIRYISVVAERHSGSRWFTGFLREYFRDKDVMVTPTLCTWKHWFQDRIHQDVQDGKRPCRGNQQCPACLDTEHTLVVVMWRNPYDWISGMHSNPHHAKAHRGVQDLEQFMTLPWIMGPEKELRARKDALIKAEEELPCIDNFLPNEVLPCKDGDRSSIYELDRDGRAYGNIYELRKAKILDFNAVETWVPFYEKVVYEDMLIGPGLQDWLRSLETKYGLVGNYMDVPDDVLETNMARLWSNMYYTNSEHCAPNCTMGGVAGATAVEVLHQMWDEELESAIGYHKVDVQGKAEKNRDE